MKLLTLPRLAALCLAPFLALVCGLSHAAGDGTAPAAQTGDCPPQAAALSAAQVQSALAQAADRGPLWRLSKDGHDSFLYGTLHIGKALWIAPGPLMRNALLQSDKVALEMDPLDPAVQAEMAAGLAALPPVVLTETTRARLRKAWQMECLPAAALDTGSPVMMTVMLAMAAARRDGLDPAYASEFLLSTMAHGSNRPVVSLETVAMQLEAMVGPTGSDAEDMVREELDEMDADPKHASLMRLVNAWAAGDLADIEHYEQWCGCVNSDAERARMKRMIDDRNPGMARGIDELHARGSQVFAAVGTLHMVGPAGLPALLTARGYLVQRLR